MDIRSEKIKNLWKQLPPKDQAVFELGENETSAKFKHFVSTFNSCGSTTAEAFAVSILDFYLKDMTKPNGQAT